MQRANALYFMVAFDSMWTAARSSTNTFCFDILVRCSPLTRREIVIASIASEARMQYFVHFAWKTMWTEMAKRCADKQYTDGIEEDMRMSFSVFWFSLPSCGQCIFQTKMNWSDIVCEQFHYNLHKLWYIYLFIWFCFVYLRFEIDRYLLAVCWSSSLALRIICNNNKVLAEIVYTEHVSYLLLIDLWSVMISKLMSSSSSVHLKC